MSADVKLVQSASSLKSLSGPATLAQQGFSPAGGQDSYTPDDSTVLSSNESEAVSTRREAEPTRLSGSPLPNTAPPVLHQLADPRVEEDSFPLQASVDPFFPVAGVAYNIQASFAGKPSPFQLQVTEAMMSYCSEEGQRLDPLTGDLVGPDGRRWDMFQSKKRYEQQEGKSAPGWVSYDFARGAFFVPRGEVVLDFKEGIRLTTTEVTVDYPVMFEDEAPATHSPSAFERLSENPNTHLESIPGGQIKAPDASTAAAVKKIFDQVCGKAAEVWESRATERKEQLLDLMELRDSLTGQGEQEQAVRRTQLLLAPQEQSPWTVADAQAAVRSALATLRVQRNPVAIEVVPRGKHFSALPAEAFQPGTEGMRGAIVRYPFETRVYVPICELEDKPGQEHVARHELYHLLEHKYLEPSLKSEVDAIHGQAIKNNKPMARPYGRARGEFFTTMGELFEGSRGTEGRDLLQQHYPRLDQLFREVTGRQP